MEMKITWNQKIEPERQDSVWYGGSIADVKIGNYNCYIDAVGDIRIVIDGETYTDKSNGGTIKNALEEHKINNDNELAKALNDGRIKWFNNNWFEFAIYDSKNKEWLYVEDGVCEVKPNDDFKWLEDFVKLMTEEN